MKKLRLLLLLVTVLVAGACKPLGGETDTPACERKGSEKPAKAILRCTQGSIAFVETEPSSGTGVVIEVKGRKYVLTNEHVVDPFQTADVTVGEQDFKELPVIGIDAGADIALLGPLSGKKLPAALQISKDSKVERGDDVFLVGFPGEVQSEDIEVSIASGILSRVREAKEFKHTYLQTDASIGGGQSGGPLFDSDANFIGVAGFSFAEEFALALAGADVMESVDRILKGKGDKYLSVSSVPDGKGTAKSGTLKIFDANDAQVLYLPRPAATADWHLTVDMAQRPLVNVTTVKDGTALAVSSNAESLSKQILADVAKARGGRPEDLPDFGAAGQDPNLAKRETSPGKFTIPVKEGEAALVIVNVPLTDSPVEVKWESDIALSVASGPVEETTLELGGQIDRIFGGFDTSVDVLVELAAGQKVQLHARSPQGDPLIDVFEPGLKLDHVTMADQEGAGIETIEDTDHGLYGLDAKKTYEAKTAGKYRFRVISNDFNAVLIRFSIEDCAKIKCETD